jgi:polyisoprenoid-binding protein YceI
MSKRAWLIVGAVVAVVAIAGAAAWYAFGGSDASGPALPERATGAAGATASADGAWEVTEDGSFVGYRISERFVGGLTDIEAVGRTSDVRGGFTVAGRRVSDVEIDADTRTLTSDKAPRDNYIHTRALESDTYPSARFVAAGPIALPPVTRGEEIQVTLDGTFTLHGVSRPLSIPVTARWNGRTIDVIGTAPIVLGDYGIEAPNTPLVSVAGQGSVEIQLVLVPAAAR